MKNIPPGTGPTKIIRFAIGLLAGLRATPSFMHPAPRLATAQEELTRREGPVAHMSTCATQSPMPGEAGQGLEVRVVPSPAAAQARSHVRSDSPIPIACTSTLRRRFMRSRSRAKYSSTR